MSRDRRKALVSAGYDRLSVSRQCDLVGISRSTHYYTSKGESEFNLDLMRRIDRQYLDTPWYGSRQMARHLRRGWHLSRPDPGSSSDASLRPSCDLSEASHDNTGQATSSLSLPAP